MLYLIVIVSKYAWVIPLTEKNGSTITNAFPKIVDGSSPKPKKYG